MRDESCQRVIEPSWPAAMFELILERLLVSKLGPYIAGIDKQNLSVALWKGDIIIENALLRPEAFAHLSIPVKLVFGKISRLKITVPWTKLARAPVEIELSGLYVSCTQLKREEWEFSEAGVIAKLKERLELHELKQLSKAENKALSAEEKDKKKSYTERLVAKILDNLRVKVSDIHLRFEYIQSPKNVVCGITLENLECYTTNANWEMQFLDRQQSGKQRESIYKFAGLRGLGMYIGSGDLKYVVTAESESAAFGLMHSWIYSEDKSLYVLQPLNVEAKFVRSPDSNLHADMTLPEFHLTVHQSQYHSLIHVGDYFAQYNNFLSREEGKKKYRPFLPDQRSPREMWRFAISCVIKSIRQRAQPTTYYFQVPKDRLQQYRKVFCSVHYRLKLGKEVPSSDMDRYHQALYIVKAAVVQEWAKEVCTEIEEKARREGERRSLLSYFWNKPAPQKLAAALEEMKTNEDDSPTFRKSESVLNEFSFLLSSGSLQVRKFMKESETQVEGATFQLQRLRLTYRMKEVTNEIEVSVDDLTMESWAPGSNLTFCRKLSSDQLARVLITFHGFSKHIQGNIEQLELTYLKPVMSKLVSFFAIPNLQDSIKAAAWDRLQAVQDAYQDALQEMLISGSKVVSDITIGSPKVIVPLGQGESFGLTLGTIRVYNNPDDYEEDTHEHVIIDASAMEMHFMRANGKKYPIVPASSLSFKIGSLKPVHKLQKSHLTLTKMDEVPDTTIVSSLPPLLFQLSSKVYNRLLNLSAYIGIEEDAWDATVLDKRSIMKGAVLFDVLRKKGKGIAGWYASFTVFSGAYLYFFNDPSQATPSSHFYTKDCSVRDCNTEGVAFGIVLENRYGSCTLAFDTNEHMLKWKTVLNAKINEMESAVQLGKVEENSAKLLCMIVTHT